MMLLNSGRVLTRENLGRPRLKFENSKTFVASNKVGAEKKRGDEPCTRQLTNRWPVRDGEWGNKQVIEREGKMQNHKNTGILHFSASMSVSLTLSPLLHVFFRESEHRFESIFSSQLYSISILILVLISVFQTGNKYRFE